MIPPEGGIQRPLAEELRAPPQAELEGLHRPPSGLTLILVTL
jgi:hypothetical protein